MRILAVDTSTTSCSVALLLGRQLVAEAIYTDGRTHSRHLLFMIHALLQQGRCAPEALDGLVVTRGPGTFTGLRIGISTIKGLAAALNRPVVGVSSLAALATPLAIDDRPVVAMIDARRNEVYHAVYQKVGGKLVTMAAPNVGPPETVGPSLPDDAVLVGSGAVLYEYAWLRQGRGLRLAPETAHVLRAGAVGLLALDQWDSPGMASIGALVPDYIRKSDAQIQMTGSC